MCVILFTKIKLLVPIAYYANNVQLFYNNIAIVSINILQHLLLNYWALVHFIADYERSLFKMKKIGIHFVFDQPKVL